MSKGQKIAKLCKYLIVILFVAVSALIAVYPMPDHDVTIVVDSDGEDVSAYYSPLYLETQPDFFIPLENADQNTIREIRFYRKFKTICIDKITKANIENYVEADETGYTFNQDTCNLMRELSKSAVAERLIYIEIVLAITLLLWIVINALQEKLDPNNYSNHGPIYEIKRFCNDIRKYWQYMNYAAKSDLKAEVANSYLNRLWWLLEPFFNMLVYVIVFGRIMGNSIQNYATFIFSALLMWNYFNKTINYSVRLVRSNRDILTKVYVPKHVLLISNMIMNMYKLAFSLIVLIPMLFIFKVHIGLGVFWIIAAYIVMILVSFAGGMFLVHHGVYIDDLGYAVSILLSMMMFLSGIFYDVITGLSVPLNGMMLVLNPVSMFMDTMRNALLYNVVANVPLVFIWIVLALLFGYICVHIVYKNENGYVKVI